ncbi:helicase domain-containing protein [Forsythia ovata]|uniref:Helicase domain-containing protein n=1 Tax=Forsythia ovata TaxID=205694 RepID=A0ABD1NVJ5_9LAMI
MADLRTWVSDKLMSLLGYSQPTVVQYVITLCKFALRVTFIGYNAYYEYVSATDIHVYSLEILFYFLYFNAAKKASSPSEIVNQLIDLGVSSSDQTRLFAQEIFTRVEHKTSGPNLYQRQEKEMAMLVRKQKTYTLLEDDNDDEDAVSVASQPKKEDARNKKFRKRSEAQSDSDDEA